MGQLIGMRGKPRPSDLMSKQLTAWRNTCQFFRQFVGQ